MFFTQEDYRKIEKWLLSNSIKDTEFVEASTPLQGNETLAFVQKGKNVKVSLKDLIDQIFLLGVSDFLNISDKYKENYISLNQAIALVPNKSRKIGQVITFLNQEGVWKIYQFQGTIVNQWNNTTLWLDLIQQIQGLDIIDSEDIIPKISAINQTSLLLADKSYNPDDFSGLGRVYLRKNMQKVVNPNTGMYYTTNLLTQSMISKENTIYIIQYDYSLNYQTLNIQNNSVLVFNGGSIDNGTLNCNSTIIVGKFIGNSSLTGTYTYQDAQADEEDITQNQSSVLKFKDKVYDEANFSGLGRTYLRKNIVNGVNILSQDMINNSNTIYHIQYDYNLNGGTLTVPEGCTLDFQGGSFANGTIIGNNTKIKSGLQSIFSTSITIQGSWNILESFPEWFGASGNGVTNDTIPFIKALGFNCSVILSNNYNLNGNTVQITGQNISIIGKGHSDNTGVITNGCLKLVSPSRFITIKSLKIINTNSSVSYGILAEESITKLILDDIYVTGCIIAGISLTDCWDTVIQNSNFTSNNYGLQLKSCYSSSIRKCNAYYNNIGLDVNGDAGSYYDMTVQENKLTGALFNGAWGCVIDLYAEQNGYQGTNAQETSQIYVSANTGQDPSSGNLITGYFIGGIGSSMESTYNVYLNYASNNIIQVTSVRCANGIYCTSNSIRNRISASISATNTASIVNNGIMNSINNSTAVRQDALTSITSMIGEFSYVIGADRLAYKNNDGNWVGVDGYNVVLKRKGTTEERPTPLLGDSGFQYYDTTLKKYICWNGTAWMNMDGTLVDKVIII